MKNVRYSARVLRDGFRCMLMNKIIMNNLIYGDEF